MKGVDAPASIGLPNGAKKDAESRRSTQGGESTGDFRLDLAGCTRRSVLAWSGPTPFSGWSGNGAEYHRRARRIGQRAGLRRAAEIRAGSGVLPVPLPGREWIRRGFTIPACKGSVRGRRRPPAETRSIRLPPLAALANGCVDLLRYPPPQATFEYRNIHDSAPPGSRPSPPGWWRLLWTQTLIFTDAVKPEKLEHRVTWPILLSYS